jgi:hypothetical protein
MRLTSIDPSPRAGIDRLCDDVLRRPLESVDLSVLTGLKAGDLLFFDASHRVFMNSDTVTFYLDVLPELSNGVIVGIHDILWPDDYPPEWEEYWLSEQYVLAAYLLGGGRGIRPLLACNYAAHEPELSRVLEPLWRDPRLKDVDQRGFCFWFAVDK